MATTTAAGAGNVNTQSIIIVTVTSQQDTSGQTAAPVVVTAYSTIQYTPTTSHTQTATSSAASTVTSTVAKKSSGGLGTGGTIGIAVAIPVVVIAALIILGLFCWRRRKRNRNALAQRREEQDQYTFNPNETAFVPPVATQYGGTRYEGQGNGQSNAYRGWQPTGVTRQMTATSNSTGQVPWANTGQRGSNAFLAPTNAGPTTNAAEELEAPTLPPINYLDDLESMDGESGRHTRGAFSPGKGSPPLDAVGDSRSSVYSYHMR